VNYAFNTKLVVGFSLVAKSSCGSIVYQSNKKGVITTENCDFV